MASLLGAIGGGEIGRASVDLILKTEAYRAELAGAEAETKASAEGMKASFMGFSSGALAAMGAATLVVGLFEKASVGAAIKEQEAQLKLANSIQNSTSVTVAAIPALNAQADAVSRLTGTHNDSITAMQAFLIQMHLTQDQVTTLTPLVVDLAAKQGIDLVTAAKAVGKAVNGTTGGLSRMGVVVDKVAAKSNAYGATLKALGVVQGFAAEAASEHPWVLLGNAIHMLEENVGQQLLPTIQNATKLLAGLSTTLSPAVEEAFKAATQASKPIIDALDYLSSHSLPSVVTQSSQAKSYLGLLGSVVTDTGHAFAAANIPLVEQYNQLSGNISAYHSATAATATLTQQTTDYTGAITRSTAALKTNQRQLLSDAGGILGLSADLAQLAVDEAAVTKARKAGTLASAEGQKAERTYLQDKVAFKQALKDEATAMLKSHDTMKQVVDELTALGRAAGITRQEVLALTAGITGIPKSTHIDITTAFHHKGLGP